MHCYICDVEDEAISYEKLEKTFSPCKVCQAVIYETILGYDKTGEDEEEFVVSIFEVDYT